MADQEVDAAFTLQADHAQWSTLFYIGEFAKCVEHAERAKSLYDASKHHAQVFRFGGHDPCVCGHTVGAICLWVLGYPDQAASQFEEGIELAHRLHHPETVGHTLG